MQFELRPAELDVLNRFQRDLMADLRAAGAVAALAARRGVSKGVIHRSLSRIEKLLRREVYVRDPRGHRKKPDIEMLDVASDGNCGRCGDDLGDDAGAHACFAMAEVPRWSAVDFLSSGRSNT
jgi:hypothetical protein